MRLIAAIPLTVSCLLCFVATSSGQAPRPPIKVGLLLPYTGVIAINGQETSKGVEFYFAKSGNRAGGREVQLIKEDDEAKPDVGVTKIKKLIEQGGRLVNAIIDKIPAVTQEATWGWWYKK